MKTILLCIEIFIARLIDVTLGSIRTIFLVKQKHLIASIFAFIEIIIWLFVMKETLLYTSLWPTLFYALGYTVGTYLGGIISKYLIDTNLSVIVITGSSYEMLENMIRINGYGITSIKLENNKILFLIEIKKKNFSKLKALISKYDKSAFIIVNESLNVMNGYLK